MNAILRKFDLFSRRGPLTAKVTRVIFTVIYALYPINSRTKCAESILRFGRVRGTTKKFSAHHAIIPMHEKVELSKLSDAERKLYLMIARAYIAQFSPSHIYLARKISVECEREMFSATGKTMREREVASYERGKLLSARRRLPLHSLRLRTSKP